jgi:hypothetical protein
MIIPLLVLLAASEARADDLWCGTFDPQLWRTHGKPPEPPPDIRVTSVDDPCVAADILTRLEVLGLDATAERRRCAIASVRTLHPAVQSSQRKALRP